MNDTIRFHIRVNNNFSQYFAGVTSGFKLYGLYGGVQWTPPTGEWSTTANWDSYFENTFVSYADADGSGADTIGFGAFKIFLPGMPPGFDADGWTITTTIDFPANEGEYICIDSAFYPPSGTWKWGGVGGVDNYPDWWGPYCYEMQPNLVYVSGHAWYLKATPSDTLPTAMRGSKVELWDVDYIPDLRYDSLGCANVDENGYFDFGPVSNTDYKGSGGQDLFFDIYAENEAAYVTDADTVRRFMTTLGYVVEDVPSGFFDTTITASQSQSDPFFVADCILDGYKMWTSLRPSDDPGGPVQVKLYTFSQRSHYDIDADVLHINTDFSPSNYWPNTYDRSLIQHEYGHKIAVSLGFCDDTTGYPASHEVWGKYNPETAAVEGFAHWWACLVSDNPLYNEHRLDFRDSSWFNVESGLYGNNWNLGGTFNTRGIDCEGAVAGMLWDIYDTDNGLEDRSGLVDYNVLTLPHHPDGIGDSLYDGPDNILAALLDQSVLGHRPDNMNEFWDIWVEPPSLGNKQRLSDIFYEHGDSTRSCCYGIRGNVDGSSEEEPDVADLIYLVDYMFTRGPAPPCMEEANVDGIGGLDISDLVYLVDYMFTGGPELASCYDKKRRR